MKFRTQRKPDQQESNAASIRRGTPDEIASAVVFLASDGARYITGESLQISGGATAGIVTG